MADPTRGQSTFAQARARLCNLPNLYRTTQGNEPGLLIADPPAWAIQPGSNQLIVHSQCQEQVIRDRMDLYDRSATRMATNLVLTQISEMICPLWGRGNGWCDFGVDSTPRHAIIPCSQAQHAMTYNAQTGYGVKPLTHWGEMVISSVGAVRYEPSDPLAHTRLAVGILWPLDSTVDKTAQFPGRTPLVSASPLKPQSNGSHTVNN